MTQLPAGYRVGHWTDRTALTGCTVVLCPPNTVGSCDVRGSSPGSRELALLQTDKTMQEVHAVLLTGGSAFGLAAADGVMRYLEETGIGYQTPWVRVPIVPAAVIFDLNIGSKEIRPNEASGYQACRSAGAESIETGTVGAGTGATLGKWAGADSRMKGGVGFASLKTGELTVSALAVVNAVGDVVNADGTVLAGARADGGGWAVQKDPRRTLFRSQPAPRTNTSLVVLMTNARFTKVEVNRIAQRGHDGMARSVKPAHTSYDGDIVFALASGSLDVDIDLVAEMGTEAVAEAIRGGARDAAGAGGVPGLRDLTQRK